MLQGFRNDGEIFLRRSTGPLVSYIPRTHEITDVGTFGTENLFFMGTYEESLVLLNEGELLIPNDFSSETGQDDNEVANKNVQINLLWSQFAMEQYRFAYYDARNM